MEGNYDWQITLVDGSQINVWKDVDSAAKGEVEYDSDVVEIRWAYDGRRTTIPWSSVLRLDERATVQEGRRVR
jgi:hypothetical protein